MIKGYSARLEWSEADEAYIAMSPEFPGLTGVDADPYAALAELGEALEMVIEVQHEDEVPLPTPIVQSEYSGQFRLRIAKSLHARLALEAEHEAVSLNTLVAGILARAVGEAGVARSAVADLRRAIRELRAEAGEMAARPLAAGEAANFVPDVPDLFGVGTRDATTVQN